MYLYLAVLCTMIIALVQTIRKQEQKGNTNTVVYGLFSDGFHFRFLRIDDDSKVSKLFFIQKYASSTI